VARPAGLGWGSLPLRWGAPPPTCVVQPSRRRGALTGVGPVSEVNVGRRIREAREALGITQQEVARRVGMSQRAVSYAEKQQWVKQSTLHKYAEALGRPLSHFLRPYDDDVEMTGVSRSEVVQQAFEVICRDPEFGFGCRPSEQLSLETKRDIVRLYERCKGISLLPPEVG
jgi:transcriptional regulator with XRE-family HTH domain